MIGGYPTGLRQRRAGGDDNDNNAANNEEPVRPQAPPPPRRLPQQNQNPHFHHQQQPPPFVWKVSHVYCLVSALLAVLAIVTNATPNSSVAAAARNNNGSLLGSTLEASGETSSNSGQQQAELLTTSNPVPSAYMMDVLETDWWRQAMDFLFTSSSSPATAPAERPSAAAAAAAASSSEPPNLPWWRRALINGGNLNRNYKQDKHHHHQQQHNQDKQQQEAAAEEGSSSSTSTAAWWQPWLDPTLLQPKASTLTDLIDKVLTSTPRLLAIANLLLALTYQMHTAVADWFLGVGVYPPPGEWAMTGRERLGSFLVFKLLLISAVVAPDTLDLLILLSWYTLLSFLRSLAHLAAATTSHTTQSGQAPRSGVLHLLLVVLVCDFVAAAVCVALFQLAGWSMVVLLTCDCALLAVEVLGHVLKHVRQVLEDMHEHTISDMEEQQLQIHTRQRSLEEQQQQQDNGGNEENAPARAPAMSEDGLEDDLSLMIDEGQDDDDDGIRTLDRNNQQLLREDSRRLDQSMDSLELAHARRLAILDATIFVLQLVVHALTVGHFLHIWYLHGIQFTLIDGVLALHLHSALSAASKQIAERRNLHKIARNLDGMFPNATELDLKMALAAGDVCCICLGAMSAGSVKKVGCGHLYHTNCLREVVERAHSMEAAKCPLCRASVVDGSHPSGNTAANGDPAQANADAGAGEGGDNNNNNADGANPNNPDNGNPRGIGGVRGEGMNHRGERALFRFSTEGILPAWMPLPAFSFEVVRRPTRQEPPAQPANNNAGAGRGRNNNNNNNRNQPSFFRRLLLLAGAVPMSPEEEARALASLVDMFPQYDRADLLRELRDRGSAESVVESVLLGVFSGRVRGSAGNEPDNNNDEDSEEEQTGDQAREDNGPAVDVPLQQQVEPIR